MDDIDKLSPEIVVLRLTLIVFGVSSSHIMLNATIKHHIEKYEEADPEFEEKFLRSIYVDDLSSGASEVDTAYELYLKSKLTLAEGGFNLRKFVSNCSELTKRIQCNETRKSMLMHLVLNLEMHSHPKLFWKGMLCQKRMKLLLRARLVE